MTCIAITRGGTGAAYRFENRAAAFLHPVVQYGDALLEGPFDITEQYNKLEWNRLLSLAGYENSSAVARMDHTEAVSLMRANAPQVWERLLQRASAPPSELHEISAAVARDRAMGPIMNATVETAAPAAKPTKAEKAAEKAAAKAAAAATDAAPVPPKKVGPRGLDDATVITLGVDKNGKAYGVDNNPKRSGTATYSRFVLYKNGMTIAQVIEAGIPSGDITYDKDHGFIVLGAPEAPEAPAAEHHGHGHAHAEPAPAAE